MTNVQSQESKTTVKLRELDRCTTPNEVEAPFKWSLKRSDIEITVNLSKAKN